MKTILIVDFEQASIEEMRQFLHAEDFRLLTAADGSEAVSLFESAPPDLVLATALLPKLNGFELCKKITSGELGQSRPVIMYSEIYKAEKYRKEAMIRCGAAEFLDKPFPKWQLMKAIRSALSETPAQKANGTPPSVSGPAGLDSSVLAREEPESKSVPAVEDLLEVDALFEDPQRIPEATPASTPDAIVFEALVPESQTPLISNIDSAEIDAAMDAFRIDLEQEVRERDEALARQMEEELLKEGQSVLEFEASPENIVATSQDTGAGAADVFELDGLQPRTASTPTGDQPTETVRAELPAGSAPSFEVKSTASRNWLQLVIVVALTILAGFVFWLMRG